jgi:hypothetical protein
VFRQTQRVANWEPQHLLERGLADHKGVKAELLELLLQSAEGFGHAEGWDVVGEHAAVPVLQDGRISELCRHEVLHFGERGVASFSGNKLLCGQNNFVTFKQAGGREEEALED